MAHENNWTIANPLRQSIEESDQFGINGKLCQPAGELHGVMSRHRTCASGIASANHCGQKDCSSVVTPPVQVVIRIASNPVDEDDIEHCG